MTVLNIIEIIRQVFPQIGETQLIKEIDNSQKQFVEETGIYTAQSSLTGLTTAKVFTLPTGFIRLNRVNFLNSSGEVIHNPLMYNVGYGKIAFDDRRSTITAIPDSISKIVLDYVKTPTTLTSIDSTLDIAEQFHGAIISKTMERLYARIPTRIIEGNSMVDWNAVSYWKGEYKDYIIKAKKYINKLDSSAFNILGYESAATIPQTNVVDGT